MRVVRPRLVGLLAILALLAHGAAASPATGSFLVKGGLTLPSATTHTLDARAAYLEAWEGSGIPFFRIEAKRVFVMRFESTSPEVGEETRADVSTGTREATYTLHDVVITLTGDDHQGWVGLYLPRAGHPLGLEQGSSGGLTAVQTLRLGQSQSVANEADGPLPRHPGYEWEGTGPILRADSSLGILTQAGRGSMKVMGPDLRYDARENVSMTPTGVERSQMTEEVPLRQRVDRWVYLVYEGANVTVGGSVAVAADASTLQWSGTAQFQPKEGSIEAEEGIYGGSGGTLARVTGAFLASARPLPDGADAQIGLTFEGDLTETSLALAEDNLVRPSLPPGRWWVGALVALGIAVAAAAIALARRRARGEPVSLEDRITLAQMAASRERYQEAVEHVRRAREEAPGSVRLLMEEASYLGAMGQVEEALAQYEQAAALDPECDAEFQSGVLLLQSDGDVERAERLLLAALRKSPILVLEIAYDPTGTFDRLKGRPGFEQAVAEARRALGEP